MVFRFKTVGCIGVALCRRAGQPGDADGVPLKLLIVSVGDATGDREISEDGVVQSVFRSLMPPLKEPPVTQKPGCRRPEDGAASRMVRCLLDWWSGGVASEPPLALAW